MKNLITKGSKIELEKLNLPKHFEIKVFGKVVDDLEAHVETQLVYSRWIKILRASIEQSRKVIRSREPAKLARLHSVLGTQCILSDGSGRIEDAEAFYVLYQLGAYLKKFPFKGIDTKRPALEKFFQAERLCNLYNTENYLAIQRLDNIGHWLYGNCIAEIRHDIEKLIGTMPDLTRIGECAGHGPGTSLGKHYRHGNTTSYFKWSLLPYSVTESALPMAKEIIGSDPRWIGALDLWYRNRCDNYFAPIDLDDFWSRVFKTVPGSRITTVPKTALTDRTIAIEPLLNVYLQLGVDKVFKNALRSKWAVHLSEQGHNQKLAREGSMSRDYATLDLSMASDLISLKVCEMLLPEAWYGLMLDLRSPSGEVEGMTHLFDKMSSMGNGFTFALESLLFTAICRHVYRRLGITDQRYAVYGDDLIVAKDAATHVIDLLQMFGFQLNVDKSYTEGPFRESCGTDWFNGIDVRPVFLTRPVKNTLDLFYVHNRLVKRETDSPWFWDLEFKRAKEFVRKYIPKRYALIKGPPSEILDSYLFDRRGLGGVRGGHLCITARPHIFNKRSDFYFRKLMVSLRQNWQSDTQLGLSDKWLPLSYGVNSLPIDAWFKADRIGDLVASSGSNAFDITKRDAVYYKCTKKRLWY